MRLCTLGSKTRRRSSGSGRGCSRTGHRVGRCRADARVPMRGGDGEMEGETGEGRIQKLTLDTFIVWDDQ